MQQKLMIRRIAFVLGILFFFSTFFSNTEGLFSTATTINEQIEQTQQEIEDAESEKEALEGQLEETQGEVSTLRSERSALQQELDALNETLTDISETLEDLEARIAAKEIAIEEAQIAIEEATETLNSQYDAMVAQVRRMYKTPDTTAVSSILSAKTISALANAATYYARVLTYDKEKLAEFQLMLTQIQEAEAALEQEKIELDNLQVAAEAEKSRISGLISQTSSAIAAYADQIEAAKAEALAYEAAIAAKEEDLEYLNQKLAEEIALREQAAASAWRDISQVSFADGDLYLLANLIYCEAGGEPYAGQVAVGAVVINRVLSSVFPDTVSGVIYQSGQFSPVASGRLALALAEGWATSSCYQAAQEAMSGTTNVGDCLFFRTPIAGLSGITIGGHIFY